MSDTLLPCPFCHGTNVGAELLGGQWIVECECGCVHGRVATKKAAIAAWNRRAPGWQPIETAPKDGTRVLLADANFIETGRWEQGMHFPNTKYVVPAGWEDDRYDADHNFQRGGWQPTHWMPLPAPPKD